MRVSSYSQREPWQSDGMPVVAIDPMDGSPPFWWHIVQHRQVITSHRPENVLGDYTPIANPSRFPESWGLAKAAPEMNVPDGL